MPNRIPEIKLSSEKQLELARKLQNMSIAAIDAKGQWDKLHSDYMRFYLCKPEQRVRTFPWLNANNYVPPVIRTHIDSFNAQVYDATLGTMPRVVGVEGSDIENAELLTRFYFEFLWSGQVLNLRQSVSDWNFDTSLDGIGVVKSRWNKDQHLHRFQEMDIRTEEVSTGEEFLGETLTEIKESIDLIERARVERINLPVVETAPVARLFTAPGSSPSMQWPECPWFYEEVFKTEAELYDLKRHGFEHMDELIEKLQEHEITDQEREQEEYEDLGSRQLKKARLFFYFMRLALPSTLELIDDKEKQQRFDTAEGFAEEVIVTYLPDLPLEHRISKIVPLARVRGDNRRPYVDNRYNTLPRNWYGQGIAAKLRQTQVQSGIAFRQMADFGTLRNMPWMLYDPGVTGIIRNNALAPGRAVPARNPNSVQFPSLPSATPTSPTSIKGVRLRSQMHNAPPVVS
jgi:hypothetical protein